MVDLDPGRIEEVICRNNVGGYTDYVFAVIARFQKMDCPKGVYYMLQIVNELLSKFSESRGKSEVYEAIINKHGNTLEEIADSNNEKYKKASNMSHEICVTYFSS